MLTHISVFAFDDFRLSFVCLKIYTPQPLWGVGNSAGPLIESKK